MKIDSFESGFDTLAFCIHCQPIASSTCILHEHLIRRWIFHFDISFGHVFTAIEPAQHTGVDQLINQTSRVAPLPRI